MKKLFNSSSLLVGLILVLIGVLANRKAINGSTEKAIANVLFKNNYAQQWRRSAYPLGQVKPGSVHDGDTLRVVRGSEEKKIRLCGIDAPELKMPLGIESRDYLRSVCPKGYAERYALALTSSITDTATHMSRSKS
ncbi:MAG: hypothetical protein RLZZ171_2982 [Cyanobacteriota bacterium]|jgi:endonuclease YncB( thermonuclease family)